MSKVLKEQQVGGLDRSDIRFTARLQRAYEALITDPRDGLRWVEAGHALGEQRLFREAVELLSRGIAENPLCGILYRWRAHRHLSCWEFPEATADFAVAASLLPNEWDVWYHYGLSWYLQGEYANAKKAYDRCMALTQTDEKRMAICAWMWRALMMQGKKAEADALLDSISPDTNPGENFDYYRCLMMAKGLVKPEALFEKLAPHGNYNLMVVTEGYGLANYYYLQGDMQKYNETIDLVLKTGEEDSWNAFGYLACVSERTARG